MRGLYDTESIDELINRYIDKKGEFYVLQDGCLLAYGLAICSGDDLKTCVIREQYINEWSSGYKINFYNKMPKKYKQMLQKEGLI